MYRLGVIIGSVALGAAAGALVFKVVGEERIGSQARLLGARFGVRDNGKGGSALDVVESLAPGTRAGFESAVIGTVAASLVVATAVTIAIREIAS